MGTSVGLQFHIFNPVAVQTQPGWKPYRNTLLGRASNKLGPFPTDWSDLLLTRHPETLYQGSWGEGDCFFLLR